MMRMLFFYLMELLSPGAFVRRGFHPLGYLSVGAFIRGAFFGGDFVRGDFVRGAFVLHSYIYLLSLIPGWAIFDILRMCKSRADQ